MKRITIAAVIVAAALTLAGCAPVATTSGSTDDSTQVTATSTTPDDTSMGPGDTSTLTPDDSTSTDDDATPAEPAVPAEYLDALAQAGSYSETLHLSKKGIYDQLTSAYGGKFPKAAAQYAVDHVKADWNANALAQAKSYEQTLHLSHSGIHDQLTSAYGGKFPEAQADYAVKHLNG